MKVVVRVLAVVVCVALSGSTLAQSEWTYSLTPSAWGVGLSGSVSHKAFLDEVRVTWDDGFGGTELGAGLAFEASGDRFGLIIEGIILDVSEGAEPPSILKQTADATLDHQIWSAAATWRLRRASPRIDAVAGLRYIDVDSGIRIFEGSTLVKESYASEDWIDVTLGARLRQDLGTRWVGTAYLDFGAGDSELSYQLILGLGYRFSERATGNFGYRLIGTDYQKLVDFPQVPGLKVNDFHYSSMKIGGLYANVELRW